MEKIIDVKPVNDKEIASFQKESTTFLRRAKMIQINDIPTYQKAGTILREIKVKGKMIEDARKLITQPLDLSKKRVMDLFRGPINSLKEAEGLLKKSILAYDQRQEQIRKEEERKAQERAKKEEERKKKSLEKKIQKAKEQGNEDKVEELEEQKDSLHIPAPIIPSQVPKNQGIFKVTVWKARVLDFSKVPDRFKTIKQGELDAFARANKGNTEIPGVEFYSQEETRVRA